MNNAGVLQVGTGTGDINPPCSRWGATRLTAVPSQPIAEWVGKAGNQLVVNGNYTGNGGSNLSLEHRAGDDNAVTG